MLVATPATEPSPRRHTLVARLTRLDEAASQTVAARWPHPRWLAAPLSVLSLTANYGLLWFVLAALPWIAGRHLTPARYFTVVVPVFATEVITYLLKVLFDRRRPPERNAATPAQIPLPRSRSFPSSHASMGMVGLMAMGRLYPGWLPALAVLVVVLAFSRVYLAVHYLGDVVAGLLLGTVLGLGYLYVVVYLLT